MIKNVLNKFGFVRIALAASVGCPLIFASNAFAQAPPPGVTTTGGCRLAGGEAVAERVIVTGSTFRRGEQASIPVTTYTASGSEIGRQYADGRIASVPPSSGTPTPKSSNAGDGTAGLTCAALAPKHPRLINGRRRLGQQFPRRQSYRDSAQKVDILKDGASAIYGSGAVAGVVNFMMWNDIRDYGPIYEGAEFGRYETRPTTTRMCVSFGFAAGHRYGWQGGHLCLG
jgi:hypothetical protein